MDQPATIPGALRPDLPLPDIAGALRAWLTAVCLPLWAGTGRDAATGAFRERLLLDGRADVDAPLRTRVQCRQIYVFSHAAMLGLAPGGAEIAMRAFDRLMATGIGADGGMVHMLSPDGAVIDDRRDAYDHAFAVLAFTWAWRATGEPRVARALDRLLASLDVVLMTPDGSMREDDRGTLPRRQNPHMHMYEALLALAASGMREDGLARADRLLGVMARTFMNAERGFLTEYFDADLRPLPGAQGRVVEPGHLSEWSWLLRQRAKLGATDHLPVECLATSERLIARALRTADPATGLLIDETDPDDRLVKRSYRLWPQTEGIKALLARGEAGDAASFALAARLAASVARIHLAPAFPGGWIDHFDENGRSLVKVMPGSSLYHLFIALSELFRVADTLAPPTGATP